MRQKLIAGNWKMNGTVPEATALIGELVRGQAAREEVGVVVCPPYTALDAASKLLNGSRIALGAQEMSQYPKGAYTGDISAAMLLTLGVRYVILGHSERRQYHAETDQLVNAKAKAALAAGLIPIICIGETLSQRENGLTEQVVGTQVEGTLADFGTKELAGSVVAYEPVWAIGTGKVATPEQAQDVHRFVRARIARMIGDRAAADLQILYGGSVNAANARGLLCQPDIDGALVGGASLKADEFIGIINAA